MKRHLLILVMALFFITRAAVADVAGIARLYFDANDHAKDWNEGFAQAVDGERISYHSHRAAMADSRIVRATGMTASWQTGIVPNSAGDKPRTFLWVAGMADKGSHEEFVLAINGAHEIRFRLSNGWSWTARNDEGGSLTFAAEEREGSDDLFGYMKLTVPAAWAPAGKPVVLRLSAADVKSTAGWVQTFEHADSLAELTPRLPKNALFEYFPEGPHAGSVKLLCPLSVAKKTATINAGKTELGNVALEPGDEIASAFISLPPSTLRNPYAPLSVIIDGKTFGQADMLPLARYRLRTFLNESLELENYILTPGQTPVARWRRPEIVQANMGQFALTTTLYDAQMNEVQKTDKPGRYGVLVAAQTPDGFALRRYITVYCIPTDFSWRDHVDLTAKPLARFALTPETWAANETAINRELGDLIIRQARHDPDFAAALASLQELGAQNDLPAYQRLPESRDRQWWVTFKRKQAGVENRFAQLQRPQKLPGQSATMLHEGDPQSVGYSPTQLANIDHVAADWVQQGNAPLAVLVARKGVIVFQKAYGKTPTGADMTLQTSAPLASTTKMLTSIIAMQLVDQGLLTLDDPIKKILPELDRPTSTTITLRHLLTHTAGFDSYGEWDMDYNHAFENYVGQFAPCLLAGKGHYYCGNDYALAGKMLERITGKCVPYLFEEQLFAPLGCLHSSSKACDSNCDSTPLDLARVGQMMLNKGAYGQLRFFSEQTYAAMLPASLEKTVGVKMEYGLSVSPTYKDMLGFGGASGSSLRWWPEQELVVAVCRFRIDPTHAKNITRLVDAIIEPFVPAMRPAKSN